jgi:hypothetical protein
VLTSQIWLARGNDRSAGEILKSAAAAFGGAAITARAWMIASALEMTKGNLLLLPNKEDISTPATSTRSTS